MTDAKRTHSQPPHTHSFIQRTFLKRLVCVRCVSQVALVVKNPPANAGDIEDVGLIPGLGRSPGGGHGSPLQCSCLDNPMDRGAWGATVYWGCTESDTTEACTCPHMLEDAYTHLRKANAMWWTRLPDEQGSQRSERFNQRRSKGPRCLHFKVHGLLLPFETLQPRAGSKCKHFWAADHDTSRHHILLFCLVSSNIFPLSRGQGGYWNHLNLEPHGTKGATEIQKDPPPLLAGCRIQQESLGLASHLGIFPPYHTASLHHSHL